MRWRARLPFLAGLRSEEHDDGMTRYDVPLEQLDAVHVPVEEQGETQPVDEPRTYLDPEDADRLQLLANPSGAGRLKVR